MDSELRPEMLQRKMWDSCIQHLEEPRLRHHSEENSDPAPVTRSPESIWRCLSRFSSPWKRNWSGSRADNSDSWVSSLRDIPKRQSPAWIWEAVGTSTPAAVHPLHATPILDHTAEKERNARTITAAMEPSPTPTTCCSVSDESLTWAQTAQELLLTLFSSLVIRNIMQ